MRFFILFFVYSTLAWSESEAPYPILTYPIHDICVKDAQVSFKNIKKQVTPLALWTHDAFDRGSYRQLVKTRFGLDNHIQGIVRVPGTTNFILSGGDRYVKEANLFTANFASSAGKNILDKNFEGKSPSDASTKDGFSSRLNIGTSNYWHAGGLAIVGKTLAVPIENPKTKTSKIMFYDLTDPNRPRKLETEIIRSNSMTGTVLFFRNPEGRLIVGGSVDGKMEFFQSKSNDIKDGFQSESITIQTKATGQGTDIIQQCDGRLFIIDFNNTNSLAPIFYGKNYIRLFDLDIKTGTSKLISKRVLDTNRSCNFKAAGSHHVTEDGKLVIYGSSFYRHLGGKQFKVCQFSE